MKHQTHNPNHSARSSYLALACLAAILIAVPAHAQPVTPDEPPTIQWQAADTAGNNVAVPTSAKTSVVLFVMADQDRSHDAMTQLRTLLTDQAGDTVQPVVVVSGHGAGVGAAQLASAGNWPWPIVVDLDYQASGLMSVHVWPTTVIVNDAGKRIAHLPGLRQSYTKDIRAYLDYAAGAINEQALKQRLDTNGTVTSTPNHIASRHLHLAQKLLEKGQIKLAHEELTRGLDIDPNDIPLRLTLAKIQLMIGEPAQALAVLDALDTNAAPPWRIQTLRGRALVALNRFDDARTALTHALEIHPDPAVAHYFLGRVHEQAGQWEQASNAYRHAFEKSTAAEGLGRDETAQAP